MSKRRKITRSTYTPLLRNQWNNIIIDMPDDTFNRGKLNSAISFCECMNFCDQHQLSDLQRNGIAYTYTMTLKDLVLKCCGIFFRNTGIGKNSKTGIYTIHRFIAGNNSGNIRLTLLYSPDGFIIQYSLQFSGGDSKCF